MQAEPIVLNGYYTLIMATIVLLIGRVLVQKIKFLRDFNIPEPVAGGLVAALVMSILYTQGISFTFEASLQSAFMMIFFASIGLSADFSRLKQGGMPLVAFLIIVSVFIIIQNAVGVGLATALGQHPLMGLITGSITLTGGHGTGAAYGKILTETYKVPSAVEIAMVSATYGLVAGGLIGGPVARRLVNKMGRKPLENQATAVDEKSQSYDETTFEDARHQRLITATSAIETMALFAACLAFSSFMVKALPDLKLPQFVWAIGCGVVLRNVLTTVFKFDMFDRAIDVFGNASLSLFLAMALMSLKLWQLADLAGPMIIILGVQTVVMILYAYFVTAKFMGGDYDAAVLAAGHCGFGLGATPTAVANMQSITNTFGSSHKAFLIVPLVGAFFIDFVNFAILDSMMKMFG
ncbi:sodium/glutamate symporter [Alysiella filiformis]|uniref:Sodium/glutamate symporter n=1 Tax=Alysiella filiformis DSM 16848 TaxID=1120981 RepID=A0A286E5N3_9NEIS|nr:sodium/glutamate symporter [Alysiella filiformis]QMT30366.1 sodium/glutamate symporter [Alysiella filiformis]UBQ56655.1 sodium/glutamate symporter [Alysiella filiformis DSM 16848]SOD66184.1 glutamate:Na+ symporter, ESS family [Alysiella filiformis DSM 16848]